MKKLSVLFFVFLFVLTGCRSDSLRNMEVNNEKVAADSPNRLADVDFVTVPEFTYYVLLEEKLGSNHLKFIRRFVKYDGLSGTVSEEIKETVLPGQCNDPAEAKDWIKEADPGLLALFPYTYVNSDIQEQWNKENYTAAVEKPDRVTLDSLKAKGAVSRLNEMYVITAASDELVDLMGNITNKQPDLNLINRKEEYEALPRSLTYYLDLTLEDPLLKSSQIVSRAYVDLTIRVDELGNPLNFMLEISYLNRLGHAEDNEICVLIRDIREKIMRELGLPWLDYGVLSGTPGKTAQSYDTALAYANVTVNYQGEITEDRVTEKIFIR